jgi:hypothetical protein
MNDSKGKETSEFTTKLHHRSNAYKRKNEITKGKNTFLLIVWYAKPNFIKQADDLWIHTIARLPNNKFIWNFKGKHKTLNSEVSMAKYLTNISMQLWNMLYLAKSN